MSHRKPIIFLLVAIFIAGIGIGITLPVLPFFAERLMGASKASRDVMPLHITGLTSVYALTQFLFAPLWGGLSDRAGRKRMICLGIFGTAVSQVLFGLSTSLAWLYGARILGGFLSASLIPAATAYIADLSTDENSSGNMAWLGTVSSLSTVAGLALGGAMSATDFHIKAAFWHFRIDAFSMPFFAAALLMLVTAAAAWYWLPESKIRGAAADPQASTSWRTLLFSLAGLLVIAISGQIALTAFEATFPLFAQHQFNYGPKQVGIGFMVCGLVMATFQVVAVAYAARRLRATTQLGIGFAFMGGGLFLLLLARQLIGTLAAIGVLALGMAFIAPNLSALTARGRGSRTGAAVGLLSAANSLGQAAGPMIGGALYAWRINAPYSVSAAIMLLTGGAVVAWRSRLEPSGRA